MNSTSSAVVLSELFTPATIRMQLTGTNCETVLAELVDQVPQLKDQLEVRQTLLRALLERERLHSTGVGDGVAFPHARNALVGLVENPLIVFGRHVRGIPFGSIDNQPARLFFLVIAPNVTQHLSMLARLSRIVRDARLREQLLAADKADKIIALIREAEAKMMAS